MGIALLQQKLEKEAKREKEWERWEEQMRAAGHADRNETAGERERRRRWFVGQDVDPDGDVRMGGMTPYGGYGGYEGFLAQGGIGGYGSQGGYADHHGGGYGNFFGGGGGYQDMDEEDGARGWGNFVRSCILYALLLYFLYETVFRNAGVGEH